MWEFAETDDTAEVEQVYLRLCRWDGSETQSLYDIQCQMDMPQARFTAAVDMLGRRGGVHARGEADQKTLTEDQREFAVQLGGTPRHLLTIDYASDGAHTEQELREQRAEVLEAQRMQRRQEMQAQA